MKGRCGEVVGRRCSALLVLGFFWGEVRGFGWGFFLEHSEQLGALGFFEGDTFLGVTPYFEGDPFLRVASYFGGDILFWGWHLILGGGWGLFFLGAVGYSGLGHLFSDAALL